MKKKPIPEETETEMLSNRLPTDLIERVKIFCAEKEITIQDFVTDAKHNRINNYKIFL